MRLTLRLVRPQENDNGKALNYPFGGYPFGYFFFEWRASSIVCGQYPA
jgi:hypothetical protein